MIALEIMFLLFFSFFRRVPEYRYIVRRIPYSDYKVKQELPVIEENRFESVHNMSMVQRRVVRKRFCVRVEFIQGGKIGKHFNCSSS